VTDLFTTANPAAPLADRLRPATIDQVIGQRHLLAPGKPLAVAFASGKPHSMLLWGPPGVGKTTLARLMANAFNAEFIALSAVLSGVKDIRDAVARAEATLAQSGRHTILFVDEVHRFNKAQQDAFLPHVESGLFTFIGATTENPSFEVNSALLSRATVHVLKSLDDADMATLLVAEYGNVGPVALKKLITGGAVDMGKSGRDPFYGSGHIDVARSLANEVPAVKMVAWQTQAAAGSREASGARSSS
jgi:putative ATPase